ncbi:MAG: hypothetical protein HYW27_04325 [Candidatus Aenigmarchaeota archaeon]|nr:hypothetical protein [Candidatus Aenigmarchaeota archaeon]
MRKDFLAEIAGREPMLTGMETGEELESSTGLYLGIGLARRDGLSEHMPFDALSMILAGELVKRRLKLNGGTIIVADSEAKTNGFADQEIDRIAISRKDILYMALENMEFDGWDISLSSELAGHPLYADIVSGLDCMKPYEMLQLADMEYMRGCRKSVKVGWESRALDFDERHFDEHYVSRFGKATTFLYTEPGRTLEGKRMPPYLHGSAEPRLYLKPDEDTDAKVSAMPGKVMAYFGRILDLFDQTVYQRKVLCQNTPKAMRFRLEQAYATIFRNR